MNAFFEFQFTICPLKWMFCNRGANNRINHIHEGALRMVYKNYNLPFTDLVRKDNSY